MARISGVEVPDNKKIVFALTYVYGVGFSRAREIVQALGIDEEKRMKDLDENSISEINKFIDSSFRVEGDLRVEVRDNIKRLKIVGTYRGKRHKRNLPVRGQRTRHNARTRKGNKRVAVGGLSAKKKSALQKT